MPFRLGPIAPVLLGLISAQVALGIMTPLIPILLLRVGASSPAIGLVASAYYVGFLAGALACDRIVMRVGHIRAFAVFAAVAADAALLLVFCAMAWQVAALRLLIGFASSGMFLVVESWLNDRADPTNRGRAFGAYLVASWGASALGPLVLNVVDGRAGDVRAGRRRLRDRGAADGADPAGQPGRCGRRRISRSAGCSGISPVGMACCLGSGLINGAYYSLVPVYLERQDYGSRLGRRVHLGGDDRGAAGAVSGWHGVRPVRPSAGAAGRRSPPGFCSRSPWHLPAGMSLAIANVLGFLFAFMTAPLYGLGAGQTNDRMERGDYVAASGGLLFTWSLGSAVGPGVAGVRDGPRRPGGAVRVSRAGAGRARGCSPRRGCWCAARCRASAAAAMCRQWRRRRGNSEFVSRAVSVLRCPGATESVWQAVLDQTSPRQD